jgi:hypothetical protein
MPCVCRTSTLALFIHRIAHISIESTSRNTPTPRHLSGAKRKTTALQLLLSHPRRYSGSTKSTSYPESASDSLISLDQSPPQGSLAQTEFRKCPLNHIAPDSSARVTDYSSNRLSSLRDFRANQGAAVLEITPETIDALATEAARLEITPDVSGSMKTLANVPSRNSSESRERVSKFRRTPQGIEDDSQRPAIHRSSTPTIKASKPGKLQEEGGKTTRSISLGGAAAAAQDHAGKEREPWQIQKSALKEKFKEGWSPRKRLSPDALAGIRAIHAEFPEQYTTSVLAEKFEVSPEAIRRILKSKWSPNEEEELDRQRRWFSRGKKVWGRYAELGLKPPARWRRLGIGERDRSSSDQSTRANAVFSTTVRNTGHNLESPEEEFREGTIAERIL